MEKLSPVYISALAAQLASLSAFLGGFSATFLATLLTWGHKTRLMMITVGLAVASAVAFIVTVVAATMLTAIYHASAPRAIAASSPALPRATMAIGFLVGTLSLLASLGCSGWIKSRTIGALTTTCATIGAILIAALTLQIN